MKNSTKFKIGDRVKCGEFFHCGRVAGLHPGGNFLMIKRDDGVSGPAWNYTEFAGMWAIRLESAIKLTPMTLTNK